jgi:hypothetical protein
MAITIKKFVGEEVIANWNWEASVKKVQGFYVGSWKNLSKELLETLYQAKLQLNQGAGNPHGRKTWSGYCRDAFWDEKAQKMMVSQRTIENWLRRYEIGEAAYAQEQREKREAKLARVPVAFNDDELFIEGRKKNADGSYTIRMSFSEYPDMLFEETITI